MSQFNLKFIFSLLILGLGVTEILVFNEEVFIFVCFFIFFNLISVFAGNSIRQAFQDISGDLERNFLQISKEAKVALSKLVFSKGQALNSMLRVLVFFKAFRNIAIQKGLLSASESFVQNIQTCRLALTAFKSRSEVANFFSDPVAQTFVINAKYSLKHFYTQSPFSYSAAKSSLVSTGPKHKARLVDRLLITGFLSSPKATLL
uniref:ATP synthase F0 subunit b n=2 Tax=Pavlovaceae TaxID=418969 RepID=E9P6A3_DIALT|nr:ATP synthase F0 subunit b [Diacronema lutheri]QHD45383.1 ATP synthase F0 subunit b [Pavlova sp. NIVA-4/92]|mmetsp:Transcript_2003/g.6485  ORF Transcript_2003/g.6485 Transcript_2003/m.6485 type:complete len:204 (+) Transcript_2003:233-844(+)